MAKRSNLYGLRLRVVMFFNRNPEEELSLPDIAEKFNVPLDQVRPLLHDAVKGGELRKVSRGGGPDSYAVYGAGPVVLELLGIAMEACAPAGNLAAAGRR